MDITAVTALFTDLTTVELTHWVEQGWVIPDAQETTLEFREIDIARVRLIRDLRHDMEIGEDVMSLVLSLLDQVYELRSQLKSVVRALETQPDEVRLTILRAMRT
jgi:chaperone modulatory protein CbpM